MLRSGALGLQHHFVKAPGAVYLSICTLMRKQWLMALLTMLCLRFQVIMGQFDRRRGIKSIRGHIFGILASISMVVGYYNPELRDTRVLGQRQLNPHHAVLVTRLMAVDEMNRQLGGMYSDLLTIFMSGVVYTPIVLVLRMVVRSVYQLGEMLMAAPNVAVAPSNSKRKHSIRTRKRIIRRRSFFTCRTDKLPSTCNTLWIVEGLTCGWSNDVMISVAGPLALSPRVDQTSREMLMNIVQLSEPLDYLRLRLGLNRANVYTYSEVATQQTFMTMNKVMARRRLLPQENEEGRVITS